mmetsp:Transcript_31864/g.96321  ORF Transcript_31864/g.96321 Transcript_31864/m.96321 type:complete len:245 (-) Transcript_31864:1420-2154(-)
MRPGTTRLCPRIRAHATLTPPRAPCRSSWRARTQEHRRRSVPAQNGVLELPEGRHHRKHRAEDHGHLAHGVLLQRSRSGLPRQHRVLRDLGHEGPRRRVHLDLVLVLRLPAAEAGEAALNLVDEDVHERGDGLHLLLNQACQALARWRLGDGAEDVVLRAAVDEALGHRVLHGREAVPHAVHRRDRGGEHRVLPCRSPISRLLEGLLAHALRTRDFVVKLPLVEADMLDALVEVLLQGRPEQAH